MCLFYKIFPLGFVMLHLISCWLSIDSYASKFSYPTKWQSAELLAVVSISFFFPSWLFYKAAYYVVLQPRSLSPARCARPSLTLLCLLPIIINRDSVTTHTHTHTHAHAHTPEVGKYKYKTLHGCWKETTGSAHFWWKVIYLNTNKRQAI